jgi:acetyl-CoA hydrolase
MVPTALADHVEKNNLQGQLKYTLFVGASSGAETENRWARLNMIERRSPHQVGKEIAKGINNGQIKFFDKHLSMFPSDLVYVSIPGLMRCTTGQGSEVPAAGSGKPRMIGANRFLLSI